MQIGLGREVIDIMNILHNFNLVCLDHVDRSYFQIVCNYVQYKNEKLL